MSGQQCADVCYGVYSEMMARAVRGGGLQHLSIV